MAHASCKRSKRVVQTARWPALSVVVQRLTLGFREAASPIWLRSPVNTLWTFATVLMIALIQMPSTWAQSPEPGGEIRTRDTGLGSLDVEYFLESSASDTEGSLNITVNTVKGPLVSDRDLDIVLYNDSVGVGSYNDVAIHMPVHMSAGQIRTQVTYPFFLYGGSQINSNQSSVVNWDVGVAENGRSIEESRRFSGRTMGGVGMTMGGGMPPGRNRDYHFASRTQSYSSMLHIIEEIESTASPTAVRLWLAFEPGNLVAASAAMGRIAIDEGAERDISRNVTFRAWQTVPDWWQYFLQYRLVTIEAALWKKLKAERPELCEHLRTYVAAGGNLLFLDTRDELDRTAIDEWLFAGRAKGSVDWRRPLVVMDDWWTRDPTLRLRTEGTNGLRQSGRNQIQLNEETVNTILKWLSVDSQLVKSPLTLGGCVRDAFTLSETWFEVRYGSLRRATIDLDLFLMADNNVSISPTGAPVVAPAVMPVTQNDVADGQVVASDGTANTRTPSDSFTNQALSAAEKELKSSGDRSVTLQTALSLINLDPRELPFQTWQTLENLVQSVERTDLESFAIRDHLFGRVAYLAPKLSELPQEVLTSVASEFSMLVPAGIHSMQDGMWQFRNLNESVGKPPVWEFCGIVLLFGLMIGPGLLVFTAWMRRRSLLMMLVPVLSVVATGSIVAYELMHERFQTSLRINSVVSLDERTGECYAWSRQTFYAGQPSREGLVFPNDVYFRPIDTDFLQFSRSFRTSRREGAPRDAIRSHIYFEGDQVRWVGGLRAREQQQLFVGNKGKMQSPVKLERISAKGVRIHNVGSEQLPFVLVRDDDNQYFLAESIDPGVSSDCSVRTIEELGGVLSRIRNSHVPEVPDGVRQWARWVGATQQGSPMELIDRVWRTNVSEDIRESRVPPMSYVTTTTNCSAVYLPLPDSETESRYLIIGRFEWSKP